MVYPGVAETLSCDFAGHSTVHAGDHLKLGLPADSCHLFDAAGHAYRRHYVMPQVPVGPQTAQTPHTPITPQAA